MKIGIIGGGVVGHATAKAFVEHVEEVRVYDVVKERSTHCLAGVLQCDLVFICLPTPQKKDALECDTSSILQFFADLDRFGCGPITPNVVLRSTVPIGFTRRMRDQYHLPNLVHSPEFLTARCAVTDAMLPTRNIVGVPEQPDGSWDGAAGDLLCALYDKRFPEVPVLRMYSDESEAVKLFLNSFFAVKVAYFTTIKELSDKLELNWQRVLEGVLCDGRISHNHTSVPGHDSIPGFGGSCLPKDSANLIHCFKEAGLPENFLTKLWQENTERRNRASGAR